MTKKLIHCCKCGEDSFFWVGDKEKEQVKCLNERNIMAKRISRILYTDKTPYEKKIALFNLCKDLEVGRIKSEEKRKIDLLFRI